MAALELQQRQYSSPARQRLASVPSSPEGRMSQMRRSTEARPLASPWLGLGLDGYGSSATRSADWATPGARPLGRPPSATPGSVGSMLAIRVRIQHALGASKMLLQCVCSCMCKHDQGISSVMLMCAAACAHAAPFKHLGDPPPQRAPLSCMQSCDGPADLEAAFTEALQRGDMHLLRVIQKTGPVWGQLSQRTAADLLSAFINSVKGAAVHCSFRRGGRDLRGPDCPVVCYASHNSCTRPRLVAC